MGNISFTGHVDGFSTETKKSTYFGSRFAAVGIPEEKNRRLASPEFGTVKVRNIIITGGLKNYAGSTAAGTASAGSAVWQSVTALHDRYQPFTEDSVEELTATLAGQKPVILEMMEQFINDAVASEIDAISMSDVIADYVTAGGTIDETVDYNTVGAFKTLLGVRKRLANAHVPYERKVFTFVSNDFYEKLQSEIIDKNGLANPNIVTLKRLEGGRDHMDDAEYENVYEGQFNAYQGMIIIPQPDDRMYSKYVLLDGTTAGQTAGGYSPAVDAKKIEIAALPKDTFYVVVQYVNKQLFIPSELYVKNEMDIRDYNKKLVDAAADNSNPDMLSIGGILQSNDGFKAFLRIRYGAGLFNANANQVVFIGEYQGGGSGTSTSTSETN